MGSNSERGVLCERGGYPKKPSWRWEKGAVCLVELQETVQDRQARNDT